MLLETSLKCWQEYGLNSQKELRLLNINELIINLGCEKYGIKATCIDILEGRTNKTNKPIDVIWIREENRFLLEDGHHRVVEGILAGKQYFMCNIDWKGYTLLFNIPEVKNRFNPKKHSIKQILSEVSMHKKVIP